MSAGALVRIQQPSWHELANRQPNLRQWARTLRHCRRTIRMATKCSPILGVAFMGVACCESRLKEAGVMT